MTSYTVYIGEVQNTATDMSKIAKDIQTTLSNLDNQVKANLAEWTSAAQTSYAAAKQKWDAAAVQMAIEAAIAASSLDGIADSYASAEAAGVTMWG